MLIYCENKNVPFPWKIKNHPLKCNDTGHYQQQARLYYLNKLLQIPKSKLDEKLVKIINPRHSDNDRDPDKT